MESETMQRPLQTQERTTPTSMARVNRARRFIVLPVQNQHRRQRGDQEDLLQTRFLQPTLRPEDHIAGGQEEP